MDFDAEFEKITKDLNIPFPDVAMGLADLNEAVEALTNASYFLAKYVTKVIKAGQGALVDFPESMVNIIPGVTNVCLEIADVFHDYVCETCTVCDCEDGECDCEDFEEDEEE